MGRQDRSRLKQRLRAAAERYDHQIELLLGEAGPLIRGSFGRRGRVCGNPGCHCSRGELHESAYLTATHDGRVRQVHVPAGEEVKVAEGVQRYRRFREARARLEDLAQVQLELVDQLGRSLLMPYPPGNPLPPPHHRGPRPRGGRRGGR
jgi:hypothetical protein